MTAFRKIQSVGENGKVLIDVPKEFGGKVEVIIFPVTEDTEDDKGVDWEEFFDVQNG